MIQKITYEITQKISQKNIQKLNYKGNLKKKKLKNTDIFFSKSTDRTKIFKVKKPNTRERNFDHVRLFYFGIFFLLNKLKNMKKKITKNTGIIQ